jgi:hypothetical protein
VKCSGSEAEGRSEWVPKGAAMEVDRVSQMGGLRQEADPSWMREKMRRRKFVQDLPESEAEDAEPQASEAVEEETHKDGLDVIA